jgi:hypothetical protein
MPAAYHAAQNWEASPADDLASDLIAAGASISTPSQAAAQQHAAGAGQFQQPAALLDERRRAPLAEDSRGAAAPAAAAATAAARLRQRQRRGEEQRRYRRRLKEEQAQLTGAIDRTAEALVAARLEGAQLALLERALLMTASYQEELLAAARDAVERCTQQPAAKGAVANAHRHGAVSAAAAGAPGAFQLWPPSPGGGLLLQLPLPDDSFGELSGETADAAWLQEPPDVEQARGEPWSDKPHQPLAVPETDSEADFAREAALLQSLADERPDLARVILKELLAPPAEAGQAVHSSMQEVAVSCR